MTQLTFIMLVVHIGVSHWGFSKASKYYTKDSRTFGAWILAKLSLLTHTLDVRPHLMFNQ